MREMENYSSREKINPCKKIKPVRYQSVKRNPMW